MGGGSSSSTDSGASLGGGESSASYDTSSDYSNQSSSSFDSSSYSSDSLQSMGPQSAGGGMSSREQLQMAMQQEQQRAVMQAAIAKLTELCFDTCVNKPDSSLSSSETTCIQNCSARFLDVSMFVMQRMAKGAGQ